MTSSRTSFLYSLSKLFYLSSLFTLSFELSPLIFSTMKHTIIRFNFIYSKDTILQLYYIPLRHLSIPNFAAASYPFSPVIRAPSFSVPFLFFSSSAYMRPDSFSIHASCTVVVKLIRAQILSFRPLHGIAVDRCCAEVPRIL